LVPERSRRTDFRFSLLSFCQESQIGKRIEEQKQIINRVSVNRYQKEVMSEKQEEKDIEQEANQQEAGEQEQDAKVEAEGTDNQESEESALTEEEKLKLEVEAMNDKYLRLYSEFENFRRRTQKEKLELYKTAGEDIFKSLLPVMDDFERAKKSIDDGGDLESLKQGVDLIYNKMLNVFRANGAKPMESSVGKEFDSEIHEAVTQIPAPSKKEKGKVMDEIEKGYTLNDKVIRFAKVVVGQ
jgi:molecular chaperone GrpE